ncbi:MAG: PIG-L family deacetylase [Clostridia bacterium]|nr:PIG-L family deacetylase [Clostridia bacterium]
MRSVRRKIALLLILFCLMLLCVPASAEEVTRQCRFRFVGGSGNLADMLDRNYNTACMEAMYQEYVLEITPGETPVRSVYIEFGFTCLPFRVEAKDAAGTWQTIAVSAEKAFSQEYLAFPTQTEQFRIVFTCTADTRSVSIDEIYLFSDGEVGERYSHVWQDPVEKADLLVFSTHPDDELLWLGGTIPYYAGERGMQVEVCYLTCATYARWLELLNGLWHCGVRSAPDVGGFDDGLYDSLDAVYAVWGRGEAERYIVRCLRRYRPEVVVTQDVDGEYGHKQHVAMVAAVLRGVDLAADPAFDPQSAAEYGVWSVKKLYCHLGEEPTIVMDWDAPLASFGGKTAFDVTEEAFALHESQAKNWTVARKGTAYDGTLFTLMSTTVGPDEAGNDFFEHISADGLSASVQQENGAVPKEIQ